jgi:hypothetical protein
LSIFELYYDKPLEVDCLIKRIEAMELDILKQGGFFDSFMKNGIPRPLKLEM